MLYNTPKLCMYLHTHRCGGHIVWARAPARTWCYYKMTIWKFTLKLTDKHPTLMSNKHVYDKHATNDRWNQRHTYYALMLPVNAFLTTFQFQIWITMLCHYESPTAFFPDCSLHISVNGTFYHVSRFIYLWLIIPLWFDTTGLCFGKKWRQLDSLSKTGSYFWIGH